MRHLRVATLAAALIAAAGCSSSRPSSGGGSAGTVTVPGGGPSGGDVSVSVAECTKCHGDASRSQAATDAAGVAIAPPRDASGLVSGGSKIGAHQGHLRGTNLRGAGVACASCHVVPTDTAGHVPALRFRGLATAAWPGKPAISPTYSAGSCSATYCHGNFPGGLNKTMSWTGAAADAACGSCHGAPPQFQTNGTTPHSTSTACATCHGAGYDTAGISGAALVTHLNGQLDLLGLSCTACHGTPARPIGNMLGVTYDPNQAAAPPVDSHGSASGVLVGVHLAHVNPSAGGVYKPVACTECHPDNAGNTSHSNGVVNVTFTAATGANQAGYSPTFVQGNGTSTATTCATYCHGATLTGAFAGSVTTWAWNGAPATCGSCHADPPASPGHAGVTSSTSCGGCHPGYTATTVNLATHINGRLDGGEAGGNNCSLCHAAIWQGMNGAVAKASRHAVGNVVGTNDAFTDSGISWISPLSGNAAAARSCVNMCHGDHPHDLTSPAAATHDANVYADASSASSRGGTTRTAATRSNKDFDASATNGGLCASCHRSPVDAARAAVDKTAFAASAHDFTAVTVGSTGYTWRYQLHDGSFFARDCTKCHASNVEGRTPTVTATGSGTTAVHFGDNDALLAGVVNPNGTAAGFFCFNCHGSTASPADGAQGDRSGVDIQTMVELVKVAGQSGHPVEADAVHDSAAELANAAFGNALGVAAGAGQRHVNCLDCHVPHQTQAGDRVVGSNVAGPQLQGAWGAQLAVNPAFWAVPTGTNLVKKVIAAGTDLEATLCFKCHSAFYGTLPTSPSSVGLPAPLAAGFAETDQAQEFNPANAGNWATTAPLNQWNPGETAGSFHPVLADASGNLGAINLANLVTTNLAWSKTSRNKMTCTDCHASDTVTDPTGPHGSAARFILKGPNTTWNAGVLLSATAPQMPNGTFCANCHSQTFASSRTVAHAVPQHNGLPGGQMACFTCHVAIPHGSMRPGLLSAKLGGPPLSGTGPTVVVATDLPPYNQSPAAAAADFGISTYPTTQAGTWGNGNCGCGNTLPGGHPQ